jgi:hypothetical protein
MRRPKSAPRGLLARAFRQIGRFSGHSTPGRLAARLLFVGDMAALIRHLTILYLIGLVSASFTAGILILELLAPR